MEDHTIEPNGARRVAKRRIRVLALDFEIQLAQRGSEATPAERQLCRSLAALSVSIEKAARIDPLSVSRLVGTQSRLARRLGLVGDAAVDKRTGAVLPPEPRGTPHSLEEYCEQRGYTAAPIGAGNACADEGADDTLAKPLKRPHIKRLR